MRAKQHWTRVHIELDNDEPVALDVKYEICPAEPDVNIPTSYIEICTQEIDGHYFELTAAERERVEREINDELAYGPDEPF